VTASASYQEWLAEGQQDDPAPGATTETSAQWPRDDGEMSAGITEAERQFWQDQARAYPGPDESQLQRWAEHDAEIDSQELGQ
jgi:hypothetical protein